MCLFNEFLNRLRKLAWAGLIVAIVMLIFGIASQVVFCNETRAWWCHRWHSSYDCGAYYRGGCPGYGGGVGIGAGIFGIIAGVLGILGLGRFPNPIILIVHCVFCIICCLLDFGVFCACCWLFDYVSHYSSSYAGTIVCVVFVFFLSILHFIISVMQSYYMLSQHCKKSIL